MSAIAPRRTRRNPGAPDVPVGGRRPRYPRRPARPPRKGLPVWLLPALLVVAIAAVGTMLFSSAGDDGAAEVAVRVTPTATAIAALPAPADEDTPAERATSAAMEVAGDDAGDDDDAAASERPATGSSPDLLASVRPEADTVGTAAGEDAGGDDGAMLAAFGATRFARAYLNWNSDAPELRAQALAAFLPAGTDAQLGWDGSGRQAAAAIVPVRVLATEADRYVVTVAAQISGVAAPREIHLQLTVGVDPQGRTVVLGQPAYVAAPPPADVPATDLPAAAVSRDDPLFARMVALMEQYAALASVQDPSLVAEPLPGLRGTVSLLGVDDLRRNGDGVLAAIVRWRDDVTGSGFTQTYAIRTDDAAPPLVTAIEVWHGSAAD